MGSYGSTWPIMPDRQAFFDRGYTGEVGLSDQESSTELELEMQKMLSSTTDPFGNKHGFSLQAMEDDVRARQKLLLMLLIPIVLFALAWYFG